MNTLPNNKLMAKLVSSADSSRFILICDQLESDSRHLVQTLVYNRLKQMNVNMVCIENDLSLYLDSIQKPQNSHIFKAIDLFSKYESIDSHLSHQLIQCLADISNDSIVLIDSLTPILLMDSLSETCRLLNEMSNRFKQLICVLHVDCHSQHISESMEQLSHSVIHLSTNKVDKNPNSFKAIIRNRKPHRKTHFLVQQSMELFTISDNNIVYVKDSNSTNSGQNSGQPINDPTLNLPFNLRLKDNELEAKNSLLLPYIKTEVETKVYYEFDKNDDIDEEDPDEDLEI